jgi:hypothetical protein
MYSYKGSRQIEVCSIRRLPEVINLVKKDRDMEDAM